MLASLSYRPRNSVIERIDPRTRWIYSILLLFSIVLFWDLRFLLFFFVLIVQLADATQYLWSQLPGRHAIVPSISPARTWEGLLGSAASVTLVGAALWFLTPYQWWQAALASLVVSLTAFGGGLTMSAIKRDRGVKDYGTLIEGHGGILDRIDSLCFSAPVFFHLTYLFVNLS